jgi:hypothetical protein
MEISIGGEALGKQLGADDGAIVEFDETAGRLAGEEKAGDAGDQ